MDRLSDTIPGQTPLHPDELADLIPAHLTLKRELNEWEFMNISEAVQKYFLGPKKTWDLTDPTILKKIHADMFNQTWKWAGSFRKRDTNIGCDWRQIQIQLKDACDDFSFWIQNDSFSPAEVAIRFHHRLISIHPFPNGNGRHGRLIADLHLHQIGEKHLGWKGKNLIEANTSRNDYLKAMRLADQGNFQPLIEFAVNAGT